MRVLTVRNWLALGAAMTFFVITPALAVGLTDADHEYLATQDVKRGSSVINGLSPKEQARLHALINDPGTDNDPVARAKIVRDVLNEFEANQDWEKKNPGQLWDAPKRDGEKRSRDLPK
jgi:hypothetical protein